MTYRYRDIKLPLNYTNSHLIQAISHHIHQPIEHIANVVIERRSIDARQKPCYNISVLFECSQDLTQYYSQYLTEANPPVQTFSPTAASGPYKIKPVVIGAGPAGLMAALYLAEHGADPIILEQGSDAATRAVQISEYLKTGTLNQHSNILFGEGGAGLFSDGKLTSRHKDRLTMKYFFKALVACGAPKNILIDAEPHLGSDVLLKIIPRLRKLIEKRGGQFQYDVELTDITLDNRTISVLHCDNGRLQTNCCILATGHSARSIYSMIKKNGVTLDLKPFAIGVRIEIRQELINRAQYGKYYLHPELGAASYRLTRKADKAYRACYTFCMCPGGEVIPCASSPGMLTSNGMSWSKRDGQYANAAFLVPIEISDYDTFNEGSALAGLQFQQAIEQAVFTAGSGNNSLPASTLSDFLNQSTGQLIPADASCSRIHPGAVYEVLPPFIYKTLAHTIPIMINRFGKLDYGTITVYGAETRSSSPIRITRDKQTMMSVNTTGLFPCGEGSGYAGGIVSSAIDGINAAKSALQYLQN